MKAFPCGTLVLRKDMTQNFINTVPNDGPTEIEASQLDLISAGSAINVFLTR